MVSTKNESQVERLFFLGLGSFIYVYIYIFFFFFRLYVGTIRISVAQLLFVE